MSAPVEDLPVCLCDIVKKDDTIAQRTDVEKLDKRWESLPVKSKKEMRTDSNAEKNKRKAVGEMRGNMKKFYNALFLPGQLPTVLEFFEQNIDFLSKD